MPMRPTLPVPRNLTMRNNMRSHAGGAFARALPGTSCGGRRHLPYLPLFAAVLACVLLLAGLLFAGLPQAALAAPGSEDEDPVLNLTVPSHIDLERIGFLEVPAQTDPATIEVGIPCGMLEMCGQDPCLCGAVDDYGACACNGKEWITPTYTVDFAEEGIATTVDFNGTTYLVPLSTGQVDVVIHAALPHYRESAVHATVFVHGFTVTDFLKILGALAVVAAVIAGVFFGVRAVVRTVRKLAARRRAKRAAAQAAAEEAARADARAPAEEKVLNGSSLLKDGKGARGTGRAGARKSRAGSGNGNGKQR